MKLPNLSETEKTALENFKNRLVDRFGDLIVELRLFGSRSRGEGHEWSDLDVAVVVAREQQRLRRDIYDIAADIFLDEEINISPLVWEKQKYEWLRSIERKIAVDVEREGIRL